MYRMAESPPTQSNLSHAPTTPPVGYLAIGFVETYGKMGPGDAYVGWVDGTGQVYGADLTLGSGYSVSQSQAAADLGEFEKPLFFEKK